MKKLILLYFMTSFTLAQYRDIPDVVTKVATAAGGFLKLETSARAIGMGGSHVASGRGVAGYPIIPQVLDLLKKVKPTFHKLII